jgi:hypothetical protein
MMRREKLERPVPRSLLAATSSAAYLGNPRERQKLGEKAQTAGLGLRVRVWLRNRESRCDCSFFPCSAAQHEHFYISKKKIAHNLSTL